MSYNCTILDNNHDCKDFCCGKTKDHKTLDNFLKNRAKIHQEDFIGTTFVVHQNNKILGFVTLLADSIYIEKTLREKIFGSGKITYSNFPAIKIGRLAVNESYQKQGIGDFLIKYTIGKAYKSNLEYGIGIRFIVVDSKNMSREWYLKKQDFKILDESKPDFLFYDIKGW